MANGSRLYNILKKLKKDEILKLSLQRCQHGHNFIDHPQCFKDTSATEKIGFLDIESSNLNCSYGFILSYCIKELDGPVIKRVLSTTEIRGKDKDKKLVAELCKDLMKFDRVVTYYGTGFDCKMIRARAMLYNLDFPLYKQVKHTDVYYIVKHKLNLHSNRLQAACEYFDIPAKGHRLLPRVWTEAITGDPKALDYILEHNIEDVECLETLYKKFDGHYKEVNRSI